ncbi:MAG: hypothetical protein AAF702_29065 [Chloroflexota bacterium]
MSKRKLFSRFVNHLSLSLLTILLYTLFIQNPVSTLGILSKSVTASQANSSSMTAPQDVSLQEQMPTLMSYQGTLSDAEGNQLSGTFDLTIRLYADVTAAVGSEIWREDHTGITVRDGEFSLTLGDITPLTQAVFAGQDRFIGVTVAGFDEMVPRQRLVHVPFAIEAQHAILADTASNANNADTLDGFDSADFAPVVHEHDSRYYTQDDLATSGSASIHWENIIDVPGDLANGDHGYTGELKIETQITGNSCDAHHQLRFCIGGTCSNWTTYDRTDDGSCDGG